MNIKTLRALCAGFMSLALLAATTATGFADPGLGNIIYEESVYIAPGTSYAKKIAVQSNNARQAAFTLELDTRNGQVMPIVYEGTVTGKYTLSNKINTLKNQGYNVIAGINGDFYTVSTGVPLGLTIHDGKIKTSGVNFSNCLAFRRDGSAFMAAPNLEITMTINGALPGTVGMINKMQGTSTSVNFYNSEFGAATQTGSESIEVIAVAPEGAEPMIGGTITGTVKAVRPKTKNTPLYSNEFVISVNAKSPNAAYLSQVKEGDVIALSVKDKSYTGWEQVKECIGAYQLIVKNGAVSTTDTTVNPRTCVGIKSDGSLLIYAVDGRQQGYSSGMNLVDVAKYMLSKGCVTVANFDGGGSTTVAAKMPWETLAAVVNKPSGGSQRAISNSLIFAASGTGSGMAENLHITQLKTNILTRATTKFTAVASDNMYNPVYMPEGSAVFSLDNAAPSQNGDGAVVALLGKMQQNGTFTAGESTAQGYVKASYNEMQTQTPVNVLSVNDVTLSLNDVNSRLDMKPGGTKDFNISVKDKNGVAVIAQDNIFKWVCDPALGTVDQNGLFTVTGDAGVTGYVRVYYPDTDMAAQAQNAGGQSDQAAQDQVSEADKTDQTAQDQASETDKTDQTAQDQASGDSSNQVSDAGQGNANPSPSAIGQPADSPAVNYGRLIKEVQIVTGTLPVILDDFESGIAGWSTGGLRMGQNAAAIKHQTFAEDPNAVFAGKGALKLYYDMKTKGYENGPAGAYVLKPLTMTGYPKKIGMWVNGDGKGHWLRSEIKDAAGTTALIDYTDDKTGVSWTGWRYVEAAVPAGLKAPLTLSIPVRYMQTDETKKGKGVIYIDNIRAVYDIVNDDKTAPTTPGPNFEPGSQITSQSEFTIQIVDEPKGSGVNWDRVRIYLDGKEITAGVVRNADEDGVLRWNLAGGVPVSEGKHIIKLVAKDHFQNLLLQEWEYVFVK